MQNELPIPPDALTAESAHEIVRCWNINGSLQCSLQANIWKDDPGTWGILLCDVMNHIANATSELTGRTSDDIKKEISSMFLNELNSPSDTPQGEFIDTDTSSHQD